MGSAGGYEMKKEEKQKKEKKQKSEKKLWGVSLISLIITMIVIIILAAIFIYSGLNTPDNANFAKFTSEFSDFDMAIENDYLHRKGEYAVAEKDKSKAQIYYEIASGRTLEQNESPVAAGKVSELPSAVAIKLKGKEYYKITSDATIRNWTTTKTYFEASETHYITDEGETFLLPGYMIQENGETKWWINESIYYTGTPVRENDESTEEINHTITIIANNGTGHVESVEVKDGESYNLPEADKFTAPTGSSFNYWDVNGVSKAAGETITVKSDTTITAIWIVNTVKYEVTFDANGGTGTIETVKQTAGTFTLPANGFTAPVYKEFVGWKVNGEVKAPGDVIDVNSNVSVVAVWKTIQYTLVINANNGGATSTSTVDAGSNYTLPSIADYTVPTNKVFVAWNVNGDEKQEGESITITDALMITAIWRDVEFSISGVESSYEYIGKQVTPLPVVKADGVTLTKGTEYDLEFGDNLNVGKGTVAVKYKGKYSGTEIIDFTITAKSISNVNLDLEYSECTYDGSEKKPGVTVNDNAIGGLSQGNDYTVSYTNNMVVGEATVTIAGTGNYTGTKSTTFKINSAEMVVEVFNYSGTYDGVAHEITLNVTKPTGVVEIYYGAEELTATNYITKGSKDKLTRTEVGNTEVFYYIVAANYTAVSDSANILINAREISVKPENASKKYDGTELTSNEVEVTSGALVSGHKVGEVTTSGTVTNVDEVSNEITAITILDAANNDVTSNYAITKVAGKLTVIPEDAAEFEITIGEYDEEYDGTAKIPGVTVKVGTKTIDASEYDVEYANNVDAGTAATVTVKGKVDGNYEGSSKSAYFTISQKVLTLTAGSRSKVYDGTVLEVTDVVDEGLVNGHALTVTTQGSQINVGSSANKIATYSIKSGDEEVAKNYKVEEKDGTLEVTAKTLTVTPSTTELNYTGTAIKPTATVGGAVAGETINLSIETEPASAIEPGTYSATVTIGSVTNGSASNYILSGTTTFDFIIKARITFSANGGSGSMSNVYQTVNSSYTLPTCTFTAPTNYIFNGWLVNGTTYTAGASIMVRGNITVTAIWEEFIVDGTGADGKHYHNNELFTGTCGDTNYVNGVAQGGCFVGGTKVIMADETTKNIEDVQIGDKVMSYDRNSGEYYISTVIETTEEEIDTYFEIQLDDGTIIRLTGNHPLLTDKGFENIIGMSEETEIAGVLEVGDKVMTTEGYKTIALIIRYDEKKKVYNLNVADDDEIESGEDDDSEDTYVVEDVVCHNVITHNGGSY